MAQFDCPHCGSTVDNSLVVGWCKDCDLPIYNDSPNWYACACTSRTKVEDPKDPWPDTWEIYPDG